MLENTSSSVLVPPVSLDGDKKRILISNDDASLEELVPISTTPDTAVFSTG